MFKLVLEKAEEPEIMPRSPLSSRVATRVSWSPVSGLKGVHRWKGAMKEERFPHPVNLLTGRRLART